MENLTFVGITLITVGFHLALAWFGVLVVIKPRNRNEVPAFETFQSSLFLNWLRGGGFDIGPPCSACNWKER